jgi:hypothetical protein
MATQRDRLLALIDAARANYESIRAEVEKAFPDPASSPPAPDPSTQMVRLNVGDDVQKALESILETGGILALAPGVHNVDLQIPARSTTSPLITFTSDSQNLPAEGRRIDPSYKPALAILQGRTAGRSPVVGLNQSRNIAFVNMGFAPPVTKSYTHIDLGGDKNVMKSPAERPENYLFDRCYIFGDPVLGAHRGIAGNCNGMKVVGSYFENLFEAGRDSQAAGGWNGCANHLLENCFFEAGAENVMYGGSDSTSPDMIPQDIVIRGCHFSKNFAWMQLPTKPSIKALFEIKSVKRLTIDSCLFEQNWARDWPSGVAITLKSCNGENIETWATCEDVEIRNVLIRNVGQVFSMVGRNDSGRESQWMKNVAIRNLLAHNINSGVWKGEGKGCSFANPCDGFTLDHVTYRDNRHSWMNTWFDSGFTQAPGKLTVTNSVVVESSYGYFGSLSGVGFGAMAKDWNGVQFEGNVLKVGTRGQGALPTNNLRLDATAFEASFGSNYDILPLSDAAKVQTTDGKLPGADIPALVERFGPQL